MHMPQDEVPKTMPLMDNREKDTLCSFHFSQHILKIINVITLYQNENKLTFALPVLFEIC